MAKDHSVKSNTKNGKLHLISGCTYHSCEFGIAKWEINALILSLWIYIMTPQIKQNIHHASNNNASNYAST